MRGPRAQADRKLYRQAVQALLAEQPDLEIRAGAVEDLVIEQMAGSGRRSPGDGRGPGLRRRGADHRHLPPRPDPYRRARRRRRAASARRRRSGCRRPWTAWASPLGRLKTGTPPRLDGRTIDWAGLERQPGDDPPEPLSFLTDRIETPQIACHITAHHGGGPRPHPRQSAPLADVFRPDREPRAALLPVHRGQGRPLRRQDAPPDLPRAGGAGRSDRSIPMASRPRCPGRSSRPCWRPSPGWSGRPCSGRAMPSNMTTSIPAS